jgi:DNA-binding MarR family transcriptional regulator
MDAPYASSTGTPTRGGASTIEPTTHEITNHEAAESLIKLALATEVFTRAVGAFVGAGPTDRTVLLHVWVEPDTHVGKIARRIGMSKSAVATSVRRLVDKGLLDEIANPLDGRFDTLRTSAALKDSVEAVMIQLEDGARGRWHLRGGSFPEPVQHFLDTFATALWTGTHQLRQQPEDHPPLQG